jgi:hypothetical protein
VNRPNEKGVVEGTVKFARLKYFVPVPQVRDLEALNAWLVEQCRQDLSRTLRGQKASKTVLLAEDQEAFLPLPQVPFDACLKQRAWACSLSLVRFDTNDYSVPTAYAHHELLVKGYVDRVEVCCADQVIAQHDRCWGHSEYCLQPLHYLALLERKPGALDEASEITRLAFPPGSALSGSSQSTMARVLLLKVTVPRDQLASLLTGVTSRGVRAVSDAAEGKRIVESLRGMPGVRESVPPAPPGTPRAPPSARRRTEIGGCPAERPGRTAERSGCVDEKSGGYQNIPEMPSEWLLRAFSLSGPPEYPPEKFPKGPVVRKVRHLRLFSSS